MNEELIEIRSHTASDVPFIISTWKNSLYFGNPWFREIHRDTYFDAYQKVLEALMSRPQVRAGIVCLKEDHDTILSFCVSEGSALHYVYSKPAWRKFGFAKRLLPQGIDTVTHLTATGRSIKPRAWKFNPFLT